VQDSGKSWNLLGSNADAGAKNMHVRAPLFRVRTVSLLFLRNM